MQTKRFLNNVYLVFKFLLNNLLQNFYEVIIELS